MVLRMKVIFLTCRRGGTWSIGMLHYSVPVPVWWGRQERSRLHAGLGQVFRVLAAILLVDEIVPADQRWIWRTLWNAVMTLLWIVHVQGFHVRSSVS